MGNQGILGSLLRNLKKSVADISLAKYLLRAAILKPPAEGQSRLNGFETGHRAVMVAWRGPQGSVPSSGFGTW